MNVVSDGQTVTFAIGKEEVQWAYNSVRKILTRDSPDRYVNTASAHARESYQGNSLNLIGDAYAKDVPYLLCWDYRAMSPKQSWGTVFVDTKPFHFPEILAKHRDSTVASFEKSGKLKKGNNAAVRLKRMIIRAGEPHFEVQPARYYDQVGTNLSLDYPLATAIEVNKSLCSTVREWDIAQASGQNKCLPSFTASKMANTIGVAIGISAQTEYGGKVWLQRKRGTAVAVYAGKWHLPLSFALCPPMGLSDIQDVQSLIVPDLLTERSEELGGLEHNDFEPIRPIAFCRDLARGGKPQFFLEWPCRLSLEQIRKRAGEMSIAPEFTGRIQAVQTMKEQAEMSPELACFLLLVEQHPA